MYRKNPPIIIDGLYTDTHPIGYEYYCYKIDFELQVIYKVRQKQDYNHSWVVYS